MQFALLKISIIVGHNDRGAASNSQLHQMMIKFVWEIRPLGIVDLGIEDNSR
jgi:hypothetical protein